MATIERMKVTVPVWDSDKDPGGYRQWSETLSGLVRSSKGGVELEEYKRQKLGAEKVRQRTTPSFLSNDPDFSGANSTDSTRQPTPREVVFTPGDIGRQRQKESQDEEAESTRVTTPGSSKSESYFRASKSYGSLSAEAKVLDNHIYSLMQMYITGTQSKLLNYVTFPSYVQASIVLNKHSTSKYYTS